MDLSNKNKKKKTIWMWAAVQFNRTGLMKMKPCFEAELSNVLYFAFCRVTIVQRYDMSNNVSRYWLGVYSATLLDCSIHPTEGECSTFTEEPYTGSTQSTQSTIPTTTVRGFYLLYVQPSLQVIKLFSCRTLLSMKLQLIKN